MELHTKSQEEITQPVICEKSSETSSDNGVDSKRPNITFTHFTKKPRDMLECFLKVIGSAPEDYLKRFGRKAEAEALRKSHFLQNQTITSKTCSDSDKESKLKKGVKKSKKNFKKKTTDYSFITRPILVERHSSDEELECASKSSRSNMHISSKPNNVRLVTLQRAKHRRQIEREKKRVDDIKKEFEFMANEESRLKKRKKLSQLPKPNIRETRTYNLRLRATGERETGSKYIVNTNSKSSSSESNSTVSSCNESQTFISTATLLNSSLSKRRNCVFRIHRSPAESSSRSKRSKHCRSARRVSRLPYRKSKNVTSRSLITRDTCKKRGNDLGHKARVGKMPRSCTVGVHDAASRLAAGVRRGNGPWEAAAEKESRFWHQRLVQWRANTGGNLPPFK